MVDESAELPRPETSAFKNPKIAESSRLLAGYMDPSANSAQRNNATRDVLSFCKDPDSRPYFHTAIVDLLHDRRTRHPGEDQARTDRYLDLLGKLNSQYVFLDLPASDESSTAETLVRETHLSSLASFERSNMEMPQRVVDLANRALESAFPEYFGNTIPQIRRQDLIVVKKGSIQTKLGTGFDNHPALIEFISKNGRLGIPSHIDALTINQLSEKPIIFSDEYMTRDLPPELQDIIAARGLIHEDLHRVPKLRYFTDADDIKKIMRLTSVLFRPFIDNAPASEKDRVKEEAYDVLRLLNEGGTATVDGPLVNLYAEDTDGNLKAIATSGYNFAEAIVERFTEQALPELGRYLKSTGFASMADMFISGLKAGVGASGNDKAFIGKLDELYAGLGLDTPEKIMAAYHESSIPDLYLKNFPNSNYVR